jgi:hypothetical protein
MPSGRTSGAGVRHWRSASIMLYSTNLILKSPSQVSRCEMEVQEKLRELDCRVSFFVLPLERSANVRGSWLPYLGDFGPGRRISVSEANFKARHKVEAQEAKCRDQQENAVALPGERNWRPLEPNRPLGLCTAKIQARSYY